MELRKFYANNMREAMDLVRQELGEEAVVLDMRTIRETDTPGQVTERVEIWAHRPVGDAAPPIPPVAETLPAVRSSASPDLLAIPQDQAELASQVAVLRHELEVVQNQLALYTAGNTTVANYGPFGFSGELTPYIAEGIAQNLPFSSGIQLTGHPHVVALIGPSGVGKTTMAAKLAWYFTIRQHRRVGVLTTDTIRIGAVEQIRLYCQHLDVPLEVAYRPEQVKEKLARLSLCDLVIIDTPGGSQRNEAYLQEIDDLLGATEPDEVHLVVSASMSCMVMREVIHKFGVFNPDQLIFTKLDDTPSPWEIFSQVFGSGMALSYLSTSQSVSDGLSVASPDTITNFLAVEEALA